MDLGLRPNDPVLIAETAREFADRAAALLRHPQLAESYGGRGRRLVLERFDIQGSRRPTGRCSAAPDAGTSTAPHRLPVTVGRVPSPAKGSRDAPVALVTRARLI